MAKYKIVHDREGCIGCGSCPILNPKNWKINEKDGKADLINSKQEDEDFILGIKEDELDEVMEAAKSCPVNVIHVYKDDEKLI
jgi:ferredoxin|tara:strand:- start:236 stop:484 length:249 start_codon:yes stop_codon:yes gene_type:complete